MRRTDGIASPSRTAQGFAFMWVLFLVALMGLGLGRAAQLNWQVEQRERERALLSIGREFSLAIKSYHDAALKNGQHEYPASLKDLVSDSRFSPARRHLRKIYFDPFFGSQEWGLAKIGGRIVGVYSLSTASVLKTDGFELEEMKFQGKGKIGDWMFVYPSEIVHDPRFRK